jgi:PTS system mannose-specific IIA component
MIGIVIVSHCSMASALRGTAVEILGDAASSVVSVDFTTDRDRAACWEALSEGVEKADTGDGVLVLVDMFGGTPSNLALAFLGLRKVEVLTGVNLPMVLRSVQRRETLDLESLCQDVLGYGRRNVTSSWEHLSR